MRGARKVSLVVVLFLLATTGTTFAECAWVLWTNLIIPELSNPAEWDVDTAYPTMKECEEALAKEFVRLKREGWQVHYGRVRTVVATIKRQGEKITASAYKCLPDSVDPRASKR